RRGGRDIKKNIAKRPYLERTGWFAQPTDYRSLNEPPRLRPLRKLCDILLVGASTPPLPRRGLRSTGTVRQRPLAALAAFLPSTPSCSRALFSVFSSCPGLPAVFIGPRERCRLQPMPPLSPPPQN